jgi:hypothetical protein
MTVTLEPPAPETPDAGVIEEARARQRRHRGGAAAASLAAAALAALLLGFAGGSGGSSHAGRATVPPGPVPTKPVRFSPTSCVGKALQGPPSRSLLSILGVLRRPATPSDAGSGIVARGLMQGVFVNYVRLARIVSGSPYYIYPAVLGGCGTRQAPHEGIMELARNVNLGHGDIGGSGGGGSTAAEIEQGEAAGTGPPGSDTSATITMIVPDGVAEVTLQYPAGRASGYSAKVSPPFTVTSAPVNNMLVVTVPRSAGGGPIWAPTMTWRAAHGRIIRTFHTL